MSLIGKWKNRETKKKLREENIRLKFEIENQKKKISSSTLLPLREMKIEKIGASYEFSRESDLPVEYIKDQIKYDLMSYITPYIEYEFDDNAKMYGFKTLRGTLYVGTKR